MEAFMQQDGIAFLLINFHFTEEIFFLPLQQIKRCYELAQSGGRKSIPYADFDKQYLVRNAEGFPIHYLEAINTYLETMWEWKDIVAQDMKHTKRGVA